MMTVIEEVHAGHDATFVERGGRRVVDHYGRPERSHGAVRRVVGVIEHGLGVLSVTGADRVEFVDNAVSNRVPAADGVGCYALLLDPQGGVETDMYVFNAGEGDRLLVFLPPDEAGRVADDWREKTFIQDVDIDVVTDSFGVFGVYGPSATEKIASVLTGPGAPEERLSFARGSMGDAGVTVVRDDDLTGEEGYLVVCGASEAADVFDTLENRGQAAAPFGYRTWGTLTLEAGTPLFESELRGQLPNELGVRNALDFEKGCYVGQEVVSRIENRGRTSRRLVGLRIPGDGDTGDSDDATGESDVRATVPDAGAEGSDAGATVPDDSAMVPDAGAAVFAGDAAVGEVTRAAASPTREEPMALAFVETDVATDPGDGSPGLAVRIDGEERDAVRETLPFVDGSGRSARLPRYPAD